MEDRFPIIDILEQTPAIPETCQWALFLRNHDELTLEMVTDEDRDYMYRVYATDPRARINLGIRRRLAPLLGNNRRQIELMNSLLFSLPGNAGHLLRRRDRHGRQYLSRRSQRRAHAHAVERRPQRRLFAGQPAAALSAGDHRSGISLRDRQRRSAAAESQLAPVVDEAARSLCASAIKPSAAGSLEFLYPDNHKVLVFMRRYEDESILVVANLSRFVQYVELDLATYKGMVPVELFGHTRFPTIGELPYFLTSAPTLSIGLSWSKRASPKPAPLRKGLSPRA